MVVVALFLFNVNLFAMQTESTSLEFRIESGKILLGEGQKIIAFIDNRKIGIIEVEKFDEQSCLVNNLWVEESERKKGIGKALLERAVLFAKSNGCSEIFGYIKQRESPYYKKLGAKIDWLPERFGYVDEVAYTDFKATYAILNDE